ncbi:hypothetical protein ONS95_006338 [Cadophora gregata]|uniref:uncharacterized protein n=1 Tax=Cadophora gregata TaxID=51156 RepID=UPI0026DBECB3|nr:uncharacterized protein ONS95_006338 [Cadophora gregata]KAK0102740.1 hypothetical protein ONS95_006338 [Cadophora gregata]
MTIDIGHHSQALSQLHVLERQHLQSAVRVIKLSGGSCDQEEDIILAHAAYSMSDMSGLRNMHWNCSGIFPHVLNDGLLAQTRLHVSISGNGRVDDRVLECFRALIGNQNLFSLSVHLGIQDYAVCKEKMLALKEVLLTCPRLSRIPLLYVGHIVTAGYSRFEGPSFGAPYCGLGLSGGEKPPALEELGLKQYPWGREPTPPLISVEGVYCVGYPEKGDEVNYWAQEFDWSQLQKLNDIPSELALEIASKFVRLREVILDANYWDKSEFLERLPTALESLSISSWGHRVSAQWKSFLTDTDLITLSGSLPHLEELNLDLNRDTEKSAWPHSSLEALAKFPRLKILELWFELGDGSTASPKPHLTISASREIFNYLRHCSSKILSLEFHAGIPLSGVPERANNLDPAPSWQWQNSARLLCKVSILDGDAADEYVTVKCPQLSSKTNEKLTRLSKLPRHERSPARDATALAIQVALDGPLSMEDWKGWGRLQELLAQEAYEAQRKENSAGRRLVKRVGNVLAWK